jgi:hypothetical protein
LQIIGSLKVIPMDDPGSKWSVHCGSHLRSQKSPHAVSLDCALLLATALPLSPCSVAINCNHLTSFCRINFRVSRKDNLHHFSCKCSPVFVWSHVLPYWISVFQSSLPRKYGLISVLFVGSLPELTFWHTWILS